MKNRKRLQELCWRLEMLAYATFSAVGCAMYAWMFSKTKVLDILTFKGDGLFTIISTVLMFLAAVFIIGANGSLSLLWIVSAICGTDDVTVFSSRDEMRKEY